MRIDSYTTDLFGGSSRRGVTTWAAARPPFPLKQPGGNSRPRSVPPRPFDRRAQQYVKHRRVEAVPDEVRADWKIRAHGEIDRAKQQRDDEDPGRKPEPMRGGNFGGACLQL